MRTLWRRLRAVWVMLTGTGAAASVAFGLLVIVSVLASLAIPRESTGLRTSALQRMVAPSPPSDTAVVGTVSVTSLMSNPDPAVEAQGLARQIAVVGARLRSRVAAAGVPAASSPPAWSGLTTGYTPVTGVAGAAARGQPQFELAYRPALGRYSHVVAGHLPSGGTVSGPAGVVEAAVTTATAARFGLRPGARLTITPGPANESSFGDGYQGPQNAVRLVITGIIQPAHPSSAFWSQDPGAAQPLQMPGAASAPNHWAGAAFIGAGGLPLVVSSLDPGQMQLTWAVPAALGRLTAGQASAARAGIAGLVSSGLVLSSGSGPQPGPVSCDPANTPAGCPSPGSSSGPSVSCPSASGACPGSPPVTITIYSKIPSVLTPFITADRAVAPVLGLLYVGLAVMGAVVVLLGARLVAQQRAAEFTLMRARGAAVHQLGWLALRASAVIAVAAGAAATAIAIKLTPGGGNRVSWWLAGVTIVVTLVGPVLISVVPQRVVAPATGRPASRVSGRTLAARRIVTEVALVAAAVGGLAVLRQQGVTAGNPALYPSAAPVLVAIPVAVIVLRGYPLAARGLARIAGRSRGVVAFLGLARATRSSPGTALPAFALVLVLAMVAFPAMISAAVTRGQVAASWRQVGADAIIQAPPNRRIPSALQHQIASMPGVTATATGVAAEAGLPTGEEVTAVFVSPARYAAVIGRAPGARFPLAALTGNAHAATVPAIATSAAAQILGAGPAHLNVFGVPDITARVAGRMGGFPGIGASAVVVMPFRAAGFTAADANLMLVGGSGFDAARLRADVRRSMPSGSVTLRADALAALSSAPVARAAQTALAAGMAAAAGFGALVLLLSLLLGARTRDMTLARLSTMGLRRWQAQLLLAAEALPEVVAAGIGGAACAWLLAPLVGPSIDLSAFSAGEPGIVVTPAAAALALSVAGLVLAALLALAAQAVITYRRGSARALRIAA
jgi:putative ABC transport system permease protein